MLEYVRPDGMVQAGNLENGNEVIDEFPGNYFEQEMVASILNACVCELESGNEGACREVGEKLTPRARICTFGFLWLRRRFSARMASFAGADLERIWSQISRLSATSSAPAGMSSEVALSETGRRQRAFEDQKVYSPTASSIWDVPHNQVVSDVILLGRSRRVHCTAAARSTTNEFWRSWNYNAFTGCAPTAIDVWRLSQLHLVGLANQVSFDPQDRTHALVRPFAPFSSIFIP